MPHAAFTDFCPHAAIVETARIFGGSQFPIEAFGRVIATAFVHPPVVDAHLFLGALIFDTTRQLLRLSYITFYHHRIVVGRAAGAEDPRYEQKEGKWCGREIAIHGHDTR